MKYSEIVNEDLFKHMDIPVAHCIAQDSVMGAGIAKEFVERYPDLKPYVKQCIKDNNLKYPCVIMYENDGVCIFNLVTKRYSFGKPTMNTLKVALKELKLQMLKHNKRCLAMPLIGCGLDKLRWVSVRQLIRKIFMDTDIEILVCIK